MYYSIFYDIYYTFIYFLPLYLFLVLTHPERTAQYSCDISHVTMYISVCFMFVWPDVIDTTI